MSKKKLSMIEIEVLINSSKNFTEEEWTIMLQQMPFDLFLDEFRRRMDRMEETIELAKGLSMQIGSIGKEETQDLKGNEKIVI